MHFRVLLFHDNYYFNSIIGWRRESEIMGPNIDFLVSYYFITINPRSQTAPKTPKFRLNSCSFWAHFGSKFWLISGSILTHFRGPSGPPKCVKMQGNTSVLELLASQKGFVLGLFPAPFWVPFGTISGSTWVSFRIQHRMCISAFYYFTAIIILIQFRPVLAGWN